MHRTLLVAWTWFVQSQLTKERVYNAPGTCESELDCVLNGDCINGRCVCDPGFTGPNCYQLDVMPSNDPDIEGFRHPDYPAWGGRSIYDKGKWHWVGTYIVNACDLWSYPTNSAFMRAEADHPMGPFEFKQQLLPPFFHGAHVTRGFNGEFHIFGDGRIMPSRTVQNNCHYNRRGLRASEETFDFESDIAPEPSSLGRDLQDDLYPLANSPNDVHIVATSDSLEGPWDMDIHYIDELKTRNPRSAKRRWNCNMTNLAPVLEGDSTVVLAYRSKACMSPRQLKCGKSCQHIGIARSTNGVKGPYELREQEIPELTGNEDPFMWKTERGYFLIMHGKTQCGGRQSDTNTCGTLAYSEDTFTWYLSPMPAYVGDVFFTEEAQAERVRRGMSPQETLLLRHRPKITFDRHGRPLVLYCSGQRFGERFVRNFAFAFNTPWMKNFHNPPDCESKPEVNRCSTHKRRGFEYPVSVNGCKMLGWTGEECIYCQGSDRCMPGTEDDQSICDSGSIEEHYAHCT